MHFTSVLTQLAPFGVTPLALLTRHARDNIATGFAPSTFPLQWPPSKFLLIMGSQTLSCPTTPSFFMLGTSSGLKHNAGQDPDCCQAHVGAAHNPGHDKGASLLPTLFGCSLPPAWIPPRLLRLPAPQPSSKPKHLPAHPYVSHGSKRCQI